MLEYYDFTLFGVFALYLSPLYFPAEDPRTSTIASFGALAAGLVMRPVGGLIFGPLGDRFGRKRILLTSVFFMTLPTLIMGLLPTYAEIGYWAPFTIVMCRLFQGICTSGEYAGSTILVAEYAARNRLGFACGLVPASSLIGALIGTGIGALLLMEGMPSWAWRLAFILGFFGGLVGLYLRFIISESPVFLELVKQKKINPSPLKEIIIRQKQNFFCAAGIGGAVHAFFYIPACHINSLGADLGISSTQRILMNAGMLLTWIVTMPIAGYFSDKVGPQKMMRWGVISLGIVSLPVFLFLNQNVSVERIMISQMIISVGAAMYAGPMGAVLASLFPASARCSGTSIGSSCGEALFGGSAPLIAATLVAVTGSGNAPGIYLMLCCIMGWAAIHYIKPFKGANSTSNSNKRDFSEAAVQWAS